MKNQNGSFLIVFVFALFMVAVGFFAVLPQISQPIGNSIQQLNYEAQIKIIQSNILGMLNNPRSWKNTYSAASNTNLQQCFLTPTYLCPSAPLPLVIYDSNNIIYYDSTNAGYGFKLDGTVCTTYTTDPTCLFRYNITWNPMNCAPAPSCGVPTLAINLNFQLKPASVPINATNYKYVVVIK